MRILVLNHNVPGVGTYCRAFPFAQRFAARGHDVVFCCVHPRRKWRATVTRVPTAGDGCLIHYEMPNWAGRQDVQEGRGPIDVFQRSLLAMSLRFDVVWGFSHKRSCVLPARLARALRGAIFISDWCDCWGGEGGLFEATVLPSEGFRSLPKKVQAARRRAFAQEAVWEEQVRARWADGVTVISRALEERALALGVPAERLLRIHSGAQLDAIKPLDKNRCRAELDLPSDAILLGYLANFHTDEGLLLDALEAVMAENPKVRFVHTGAPFSATATDLRRRGLADRVHYLGRIASEKLPTVLGACDILLLPLSDRRLNRERWPHKITDYLSAGRPVAACDVGDVAELIRAGQTGELGGSTASLGGSTASLGAPAATGLADATRRLIDQRDQWDEMGRRARSLAEDSLDWSRLGDEALAFLERIRQAGRRR